MRVLVLMLMLAAPLASAGAALDTPVAQAYVEDDRGTGCGAPACLFTARNATDPSSMEIDASQNASYVGAATKLGPVVDQNVTIRGDSIVAPADFTPVRSAFDAARDQLPESDRYGLVANASGYYAWAIVPDAFDPSGDANLSATAWEWDDEPQGVHESGTGPVNAFVERRDTDQRLADLTWREACPFAPDPAACAAAQRAFYETWNASTPRVVYGLSWYRVQLADDPSKLDRFGGVLDAPLAPTHGAPHPLLPGRPGSGLPPRSGAAPLPLPSPEPRALAPHAVPASSFAERVLHVTALKAPRAPEAAGLATSVLVAGLALSLVLREAVAAFTRLDRSRLLDEPTRARVYEIVARRPGIHVAEIARQAGVRWGLAQYHVRILHQNGYFVPRGKRGWVAMAQRDAEPGWAPRRSFRERLLEAGYGKDPRITREWVHATYAREVSRSLRNRAMREIDRLHPRAQK